ncbi:hypothetical protein [Polaribacter sp. MED152]|uniref:hypothetical protein n=1 Tax=Polaribacter sp. MED152 TaxID=313598 RepID=UPI000068CBEF|nr:hypothetical protein [Polaribacter sp. MED152]EAQ42435.1 hypothetical protein MED152_06935 [Polaribacter sp. MED152]
MRKTIIYSVLISLGLLLFGSYFYLQNLFKPPLNTVTVKNDSGEINIGWEKNDFSDRNALLIPVKLSNQSKERYWMQLDMGAPYSFLYGKTLKSLNINQPTSKFELFIGKLEANFETIKVANYGQNINDIEQKNNIIIGTLGTDLLERTKLRVDYKNSILNLFIETPNYLSNKEMNSFNFENRRIYIDVEINGNKRTVMWDSGASAFDLITSKSDFKKLKKNNAIIQESEGNQMGRKLKIFTADTESKMTIAGKKIALHNVTYIEGFPWFIKLLFSVSGMEGMIGNNSFRSEILFLDCSSESFTIL